MKVSIVIPTHNRANLIGRAIESVLSQTHQNFEIIVVSDGSTDETDSVMKVYKDNDKRIKFISYKPARGGNAARNIGIEAATGEYVAFLDDDDEWLPNKLEEQMNVFKREPEVGLVYTGVKSIYVEERTSYVSKPDLKGDLSKKILLKNYIGTTSTVVVKKCLLENREMFDTKLGARQDYDLWIRLCQVTTVGVVSKPLVNYYNHTQNNQISQNTNKYEQALKYIQKKHERLFGTLSDDEKKVHSSNSFLLIANKAMRNDNGNLARKYAKLALKQKVSTKAFLYLCMSFFNYGYVLKTRQLLSKR